MARFATTTTILAVLGALLLSFGATPAHAQSTFSVNSLAPMDDASVGDGDCRTSMNTCTLRAAIQEANATTGTRDVIEFAVPSSGTATIPEDIELEITAPVIIDGTSSPAYDGSAPAIILDGSAVSGSSEDALTLTNAEDSEIRGLAIVNYPGTGIAVRSSDGVVVDGCFIGIEPDGTAAGNGGAGIEAYSDITIGSSGGGNVVSANGDEGLYLIGMTALVSDNVIGLDADGNFARPNGRHGVYVGGNEVEVTLQSNVVSGNTEDGVRIEGGQHVLTSNVVGLSADESVARSNERGIVVNSDNSQIGGNDRLFANVIAGNTGDGIAIGSNTTAADNNVVQFNYIGTNKSGDPFGQNIGLRVANGSGNVVNGNVIGANAGGVSIDDDAEETTLTRNLIGVTPGGDDVGNRKDGIIVSSQAGSSAAGTKIGLASPGTGNVIANTGGDGIRMEGSFTTVQNNQIGLNGSAGAGNDGNGILMDGAVDATIGTVGFGNEIALNGDNGIEIVSGGEIVIQGNYIGTNAENGGLGNDGDGVRIDATPGLEVRNVVIGYAEGVAISSDPEPLNGGLGNRIRYNTTDAVRVTDSGTVAYVTVRGNVIADNGGLGVDLGADGRNSNDPGDADTGPNKLINAPEIQGYIGPIFNTATGEFEFPYRVECTTSNCNYDLTIDFYLADSDPSGEGRVYVGSQTYAAADAGATVQASFTAPSWTSPTLDDHLVAIATDDGGSSSEFTITPVRLPVELADLRARANGERVLLTWRTLSEVGNDRFQVEHSGPDSPTFVAIGSVEGAGTTADPVDYRFATDDLSAGTHTFRLRQVDVDGSAELSRTVTAHVDLTEAIALSAPSPNPVRNQLSVRVGVQESQTVRVVLYDLLGRAVATLHQGTLPGGEERTLRAKLPALPSGKYFLRLEGESGQATRPLTVVR
ncbi:MAG: T9SS type A sorting domain-containing protein [Bacteroidetes bacterium]|jgi:CSLREA domain-containing protein|nr:T9SS type A sorting domain-containing protein [Bacteroidota bacterium]